ncbi:orotate phosphoribosyltransferase [Caproiciproducens sp. NJN-50]|uniref:orotate phosphoribosyltransferase n=1 Tax=Acutalibacteraceae TaxID=3082771 RepID=UPI000FFE1CBD|nr:MULTISPECIES: orotate phosphoribosyltransferase [Acutalibacteraceae]QAT49736.1 orotate phosphoribosyltransferase [Caproiciproducens sp. NJN-50]
MTQERALEIFREAGVLLEGHFKLTSGRHSNRYLQCAKVFRNTRYSEELCAALAEKYQKDGIEVVIGPAMGAVQMAYEVSRALHCENFFTERGEDGKMALRRGFAVHPGQRVLIVEDVVTTGGSVREVMELVRQSGGAVAGIGSIVDRTGGKIDFGVPYQAVVSLEVESWEPRDCPLCKAGAPAPVKPGSRKS